VDGYAFDAQPVRHRTDQKNPASDTLQQRFFTAELAAALAAGTAAPMHVVRANEHRVSLASKQRILAAAAEPWPSAGVLF
jgi:hypothetical protein